MRFALANIAALALAVALALALACSSREQGGFDLGSDDQAQSDVDYCANYPGGSMSGDDLLVVVNKDTDNQLSAAWSPPDLLALPDQRAMPGRPALLRKGAAEAFAELAQAASAEAGLELVVRSAYRSYQEQCFTFASKVAIHGLEHAKKFSAEPGRSQHQLGTTVDITSERLGYAITQSMGTSPEGVWLAGNAHRFGFVLPYSEGDEDITGYGYEPWHYRYVGIEAASELRASGLVLDLYLESCRDGMGDFVCQRAEMPETEINEGFIGGACHSSADCIGLGSRAMCLAAEDGYPDGSCSRPCASTCPDRDGQNAITACVLDDGASMCHSRCDYDLFPGIGCRPGYECTDAPRPSGDRVMACLPQSL